MTSNTLKHHCSVIGFYLLHQSFCWKSLKKDQYLKNKSLSYKHCLHMLIKCNFANALKLFNGCRHRHSRSTAQSAFKKPNKYKLCVLSWT